MIDGYALVEITPNKKARMKELRFLEVALDHAGFNVKEIEEQLLDQIPEELTDALIMVFFTFQCKTYPACFGGWENEEVFEVTSIQLLKEHYKDFYQKQVTADLDIGITGYHALEPMIQGLGEENNYYVKIVKDWEALYEETFVPESK